MKVNRLKHLYMEELKDLYSADGQLVKALPKMAINLEAAETDERHVGNGHSKKSATARATTVGA